MKWIIAEPSPNSPFDRVVRLAVDPYLAEFLSRAVDVPPMDNRLRSPDYSDQARVNWANVFCALNQDFRVLRVSMFYSI